LRPICIQSLSKNEAVGRTEFTNSNHASIYTHSLASELPFMGEGVKIEKLFAAACLPLLYREWKWKSFANLMNREKERALKEDEY
jgi:hypothetical protein